MAYQLLQQRGPQAEAERPGLFPTRGEVCQDPGGKVADLHLGAVEQGADVVQEALDHELHMKVPDLSDVVLFQ